MKENDVETNARREAIADGWTVRKIMFIGHTGGPDRFFAKPVPGAAFGRIVLLEMKRPGKTVRPRQDREIRELRAAGVEVYACDTIDQVRKCLGLPTPS